MVNENATKLWINGYIVLGKSTRIPVEEVSIELSRDLKEHYDSGVNTPAALIPGQEKISFKIKKIFSNTTTMKMYLNRCSFTMVLFNTSANPDANAQGTSICRLSGCIFDKNSLGTLGKGEPVSEDLSGKALNITFDVDEIASMMNASCTNI